MTKRICNKTNLFAKLSLRQFLFELFSGHTLGKHTNSLQKSNLTFKEIESSSKFTETTAHKATKKIELLAFL